MLNLFLSMPSDMKIALSLMAVAVLYIGFVWVKGMFNRPVRNEHTGKTYRRSHNTSNVDGVKWTPEQARKHWSTY